MGFHLPSPLHYHSQAKKGVRKRSIGALNLSLVVGNDFHNLNMQKVFINKLFASLNYCRMLGGLSPGNHTQHNNSLVTF